MRHRFHRPGGIIRPSDFKRLGAIDKDARNSYLAGDPANPVTIKGDFHGYDMRNITVAHATVEGDWSDVLTQYLTSFMSDWSGCILPPDISDLKHDLVVGVARRRLNTVTGLEREAGELMIAHIAASQMNSWLDVEYRLADELNFSDAKIETTFLKLFQGYSKLEKRLLRTLSGKEGPKQAESTMHRPTKIEITVAGERIDLLRDPRMKGEDRYAIERKLEKPGWRIHIYSLHPWPHAIAANKSLLGNRSGWWDWWP